MCFCLVRCCPVLYSLCSPKYIGPKEGCMSWYRHITLGLTHLSEHGGLVPWEAWRACMGPRRLLQAPAGHTRWLPQPRLAHQNLGGISPLCAGNCITPLPQQLLSHPTLVPATVSKTEMLASGCLPTASVNPDLHLLFWALGL